MSNTPGPWIRGGTFDPTKPIRSTNIYGPTAAGMQSGECIAQRVSIANAPIIEAAPQMLDALRAAAPMLDAWLNGDGTNIDMNEWDAATMLVQAAIAEASK